jgi:hypothetical protein
MESLGTAVLELVADTKPLIAGLEKGKAASEEMAATTAGGFRNGIQKAAVPAAIAVAGLVVGLHKSFDAAEENQVAQAKLATAFKSAGLDVNHYKGAIDDAEQSSAGLGFKSEDVKASLAKLVVATGDAHKSIDLLSTAQDLARFKGISLTDASQILTSAMAGSSRAARQLGITVSTVTTAQTIASQKYKEQTDAIKAQFPVASKMTEQQKQQETALLNQAQLTYASAKAVAQHTDKQAQADKVIGLVNDKLGGQADAFSKTAQGAKEKMGAEFQLLEINIGNALIPVLTKVSMVLAGFSEFLVKHATAVKLVLAVLSPLLVGILAYAAYTKIAAAAQLLWNAAMTANPVGLVILAIAALIVIFVELWKHSQTFRDIILGVWADVTKATQGIVDFFTNKAPAAFQTVVTWLKTNWPLILGVLTGPFGLFIAAFGTNAFGIRDKITSVFNSVIDWFKNTFKKVKDWIIAPFNDAWSVINNVPGNIKTAFGKIGTWFNGAKDWAIKNLITGPFSDAWSFISGIPGKITTAFSNLKKPLVSALSGVGSAIADAFKAPINAVIGIIDAIKLPTGIHIKTWHGVPDGFSIDWSNPFHIPKLAAGGIVNSPTLALIGESGPEAVIPLSGGGGMGGGITVNVSGVVGNERDVAIKIGRELQQLKSRGLSFGLA